ncbi:tetratricopeptide (TPR) repeat protein [Flavobacterium sp. 28A]|uniref:tetratricopeptide repeat protein n=1 Tax=Flavobacterium sp. 28A TaxID=2735895 RepID=UPI00156EDAB8|nr:tetratricopeptide repeat protein [Flavobacterium sp. 28A]NRT13676.1 tetratricopeptide (TPR) repeat protein [Flavobacterium sp. 28A]
MKKIITLFAIFSFFTQGNAQENNTKNPDNLLKELAENGCKCIDSINAYNKNNKEVSLEISACLNKQAGDLQIRRKLLNIPDLDKISKQTDEKKQIDIAINLDENSKEYKTSYYELERYLMSNCPSMKDKASSNEKVNENSVSNNKKAREYYSLGQKESEKENFKKAVDYFEKAVKEDPKFAFAWDNLGINYRYLNEFDKAIEAYKKSIEIDPNGLMPLQNIAVAYLHKKDYDNVIKSYEKLAKVDSNNPEVYYGLGNVYATNLKDYEKGLNNMCKAYNLYVEHKSPYRTDAETLISMIYTEMKKEGKEEQFDQILKDNHISQD